MTLGFENAAQLREWFLSCGMGFLLGAYYDVFRLLRCWLHPSRLRVFLADGIYAVTAAVSTFLFFLALNGGVLRWYLFLGLSVGFLAYRRTVGSVLVKSVLRLLQGCQNIAQKTQAKAVLLLSTCRKKIIKILLPIFGRKKRKKFKKALATEQDSVV